MTALNSPSFALRPQRDGLRQKQFSLSRPRAAGHSAGALANAGGAAPDCVFKRFPAIGDTPSVQKQRW
ncbi:hypothetical protein [Variovorax sp. MHTC-1]|jgi:hypothetical protein|uniref:hypothetical protein n=1 Tax=Variovorax sp. MHTC-1 TaxID=2495593 RepID=UPI000F87C163|nr:hypothetical protein [Variovorax sp. MHTC-1]RST54496.1 hypothetical protein EJI01_11480 [Variovorax sp. MHTC-1]